MKQLFLSFLFFSTSGFAYDVKFIAWCSSPSHSLEWDLRYEKDKSESVVLRGGTDGHHYTLVHRYEYRVLPSFGGLIVFAPENDPEKGVVALHERIEWRALFGLLMKKAGHDLDSSYECRGS